MFIKRGWFKYLPNTLYLRLVYFKNFHKFPNLKNPRTFNEKLNWLKLHDRKSIYTTMVDKYAAKEYVAKIIGAEHIIPTLGVWDRFDDIDFDKLPEQFVLKCTHDSAGLVIVKDKSKLDKVAAKARIERCLKRNFYYDYREWPYKNVPHRIIAEKYMEDSKTAELRDYKFFCFDGVCKCFKIDFDRYVEHRANYYSPDGNLLRFGEVVCPPNYDVCLEMPSNLSEMIKLAEKLSKDIPLLRVDFYEVNGEIYFGELTFYPACGFGPFVPEEWDYKLGEWLHLPVKN